MSRHIVLLGDSIFDNASYTGDEPDVITHLRSILPPDWKATLRAVDGSTTDDLSAQLERLPQDATHLVVSIGGNDALMNSDMLALPVSSTTEALDLFRSRIEAFEEDYRMALEEILDLRLPTTVCTIYEGSLPDPLQARVVRIALTMFNDIILRTAIRHGLPFIDLRLVCLVCIEPEDYANPIEPSGRGGLKIARAIAKALIG
jgi:GDSL-like Lipase/Acylhydrolase family